MIYRFYWQTSGAASGEIEFASWGRRVLLKAHGGWPTWSRGWGGDLQLSFHTPHPAPTPPMWLHHHRVTVTPRTSSKHSSPPPEQVNSQPHRFLAAASVCQTRRRLTDMAEKPGAQPSNSHITGNLDYNEGKGEDFHNKEFLCCYLLKKSFRYQSFCWDEVTALYTSELHFLFIYNN